MKHHINNVTDLFLAVRPYSIIGAILTAIAAHVSVTHTLIPSIELISDVIFGAIWWITILLFVEYRKNPKVEPTFVLTTFGILLLIILLRNPLSLIFVLLTILCLLAYMNKNRKQNYAVVSQIFRAIIDISLFLIVLSFNTPLTANVIFKDAAFIFALGFIIAARNLEGDIRDLEVDNFSLPKLLGRTKARFLTIILLAMPIVIIHNPTVFPLLMLIAIIFIYINAQNLHQIHVLTTMFFIAEYIIHTIGQNLLLFHLLYLGTILNFTYEHVPRTRFLAKKNLANPLSQLRSDKLINQEFNRKSPTEESEENQEKEPKTEKSEKKTQKIT
jgi:hypothetical protein